MKVYRRGEGEPELTVVGSVHGDEPAGKKAIENFLEEEHDFQRPVQFIIANEEALEEDVRYIDTDMNRSFPGDADSDSHEERLAAEITDLVKETLVLDIHTTHSYPRPFATFTRLNDTTRGLLKDVGAEYAVHFPGETGTLHEQTDGVVIETGYQGSEEAVENAEKTIENFLKAQDALEGESEPCEPEIFRYYETVEGDWNFKAENFQKVETGQVYAVNGEEKLEASEEFYPVLMSTNGYDGQLGFKARKIEELD